MDSKDAVLRARLAGERRRMFARHFLAWPRWGNGKNGALQTQASISSTPLASNHESIYHVLSGGTSPGKHVLPPRQAKVLGHAVLPPGLEPMRRAPAS